MILPLSKRTLTVINPHYGWESIRTLHHFSTLSPEKTKVWLDCDPGLDDTLAIILAAKHERINLIGVSTSAGNTSLENTTKNGLDILYNIGAKDVAVVKGSSELIFGKMQLAEHMHGSNGLGGVDLPPSTEKPIDSDNFEYIYNKIMEQKGKIIWANTGALTNLCFLFRRYPQIKEKIKEIVIMGGAIGKGNITPAAQFNIYFDPHAAKQVFEVKGDIPLVMLPLELTHQVRAKQDVFNYLQEYKNIPFALAILRMLQTYKFLYKKVYDMDFPPVHDPCVLHYLTQPENFEASKCKIEIDVGETSYGRTNCYFSNPKNPSKPIDSHDLVCTKVHSTEKFWREFTGVLDTIFRK